MSREIKFRAWDGQNMHRVGRLMWSFRSDEPTIIEVEGRPWKSSGEWPQIDNPILMQYIGLKDKHGTDVYEGDIVKGTGYIPRFVVEYDASGETTEWVGFRLPYGDDYEVIGNIYENPDLLKGAA